MSGRDVEAMMSNVLRGKLQLLKRIKDLRDAGLPCDLLLVDELAGLTLTSWLLRRKLALLPGHWDQGTRKHVAARARDLRQNILETISADQTYYMPGRLSTYTQHFDVITQCKLEVLEEVEALCDEPSFGATGQARLRLGGLCSSPLAGIPIAAEKYELCHVASTATAIEKGEGGPYEEGGLRSSLQEGSDEGDTASAWVSKALFDWIKPHLD